MLSRTRISRFIPWEFALKTIKNSHQSLSWPLPEASCKILYDTPDMPSQLKLIIYVMLRSRHLLLCTSNNNTSSSTTTNPLTSTLKAYSSALKAANNLYWEHSSNSRDSERFDSTFFRAQHPTISNLSGDKWFQTRDGKASIWVPLPLNKTKKAASRTQLLMQSRTSPLFSTLVSSGDRDESTTKIFGGKRDRKRRDHKSFLKQEKVQPAPSNSGSDSSSSAVTSAVSRIRFAETPSLVAEVWSNILSDGIFETMEFQIRSASSSSSSSSTTLFAISELLSSLFSSRDHLLFNEETLNQVTDLALELLIALQTQIRNNSNEKLSFAFCELTAYVSSSLRHRGGCSVSAEKMTEFLILAQKLSLNEARYQNIFRHVAVPDEKDFVLPLKICFELAQVLSAAGKKNDEKMGATSSLTKSCPSHITLLKSIFSSSYNSVKQEEVELLNRRRKNFDERLAEVAEVAEALEKNPKDQNLILSHQKREAHLKEVVMRDQEIAKKISKAIEGETKRFTQFIGSNNKNSNVVSHHKTLLGEEKTNVVDFSWSWNLMKNSNVTNSEETKIFGLHLEEPKNSSSSQQENNEDDDVSLDVDEDDTPEISNTMNDSYGSVKLEEENPTQQKHQYQTWIVTFSKTEVAKLIEHQKVPSAPSSKLLFLRWFLKDAQNREKAVVVKQNSGIQNEDHQKKQETTSTDSSSSDSLLLQQQQRRNLFFKGSTSTTTTTTSPPTPSLQSLFGNSISESPFYASKSFMFPQEATKRRTVSFPTKSSASSTNSTTIEILPVSPSVFENMGHASGDNARDFILAKIRMNALDTNDDDGIVNFLKQKLGVSPVSAVLSEIEFGGNELVMTTGGLKELLS